MFRKLSVVLLTITISLTAFASKSPRGNVGQYLTTQNNKFVLYWYNNQSKINYMAIVDSKGKSVDGKKVIEDYNILYEWEKYSGININTETNFNTEYYMTVKLAENGFAIIGGIEVGKHNNLIIEMYDVNKKETIKAKHIDKVAINDFKKPKVSNVVIVGKECFIAYERLTLKQDIPYKDIVIAKWNVESNCISYQLIKENIYQTSLSLAYTDKTLALAYQQSGEKSGQTEINLVVLSTKKMNIIKTVSTEFL